MSLISLHQVSKQFGAKKILESISLSIEESERIAIVGKNGAGKSTLINILCQRLEIDSGERAQKPMLKILYLPQNPQFPANLSVKEICAQSLQEITQIHRRIQEIHTALESSKHQNTTHPNAAEQSAQIEQSTQTAQTTNPARNLNNCQSTQNPTATQSASEKDLLSELGTLSAMLDNMDGWDVEKKTQDLLKHFWLEDLSERQAASLSGGEQKRLALATILMQPADLYVLDEPTNHLDVEVVEFLEERIQALKSSVVFISHDRYFIDRCAKRIIEVDSGKLSFFAGGYASYLSQKAAILENMSKEHEQLLKLLKVEEEWLAKGVKARRKRNEGRKERLETLRAKAKSNPSIIRNMRLELERERTHTRHFNRVEGKNAQKMIIECQNLCLKLGPKRLIENLNLRILQRDKIAIIGRNGSGKSSLLKAFLGQIAPSSGSIKRGELEIGYFDQHRASLDDDKSLIEIFCPNGGDHISVQGRHIHVFGYLKSFLFPKEMLTQKIGALSGGEKNRVALALLFTRSYDCLILDEPTNDLDIATINILEEHLRRFDGALIFVSHDRYFVDKLAHKLLILHSPESLGPESLGAGSAPESSAAQTRKNSAKSSVEESYLNFSEYLEQSKEIESYKALESKMLDSGASGAGSANDAGGSSGANGANSAGGDNTSARNSAESSGDFGAKTSADSSVNPSLDSRVDSGAPKEAKQQSKKLSYKENLELESLPREIEALESKKRDIESKLGDEKAIEKYGVIALAKELEETQNALDSKYERYFELESKRENLSS